MRSDARRNRQLLLEAALRAFSADQQKVTLEAIAREAGVGIGTLYRHFPTREALVEAVYWNELARLLGSGEELRGSHPPDVALRMWMDRFADYVTAKRWMADTLRAAGSGTISKSQTHDALAATIGGLLDAGSAAGTVRGDVNAKDVLASLIGIFLAAGAPSQRDQAGRMLDLLMDGLRPPAPRSRPLSLSPVEKPKIMVGMRASCVRLARSWAPAPTLVGVGCVSDQEMSPYRAALPGETVAKAPH